ncbi:MAG: LamG domain-containing protein [Lentisphaeraceae bacterium]|nr:LamG domain-containing protein [Lentisphaeraceae bacterium]
MPAHEALVKINEFIKLQTGPTSQQALDDLNKYNTLVNAPILWASSQLEDINIELSRYERKSKAAHNTFKGNKSTYRIISLKQDFNDSLKSESLIIHLPFNNNVDNHARFSTSTKSSSHLITYTEGLIKEAIVINNKQMHLPESPLFLNRAEFTFSLWLNPKQHTSSLLEKNEKERSLKVSLENHFINIKLFSSPHKNLIELTSLSKIPLSKWSHITAAFSENSITLYLNGKAIESQIKSSAAATGPSKNKHFTIGSQSSNIEIDDLRLWKCTLSPYAIDMLAKNKDTHELEKLSHRFRTAIVRAQQSQQNLRKKQELKKNDYLYREMAQQLKTMSKNASNWDSQATEFIQLWDKLSSNSHQKKSKLAPLVKSIKTAKKSFLYYLQKNSDSLKGIQFHTGPLKGKTFIETNNNKLTLHENMMFGELESYFHWKQAKTNEIYRDLIPPLLKETALSQEKFDILIFVTLATKNFIDNNQLPKPQRDSLKLLSQILQEDN